MLRLCILTEGELLQRDALKRNAHHCIVCAVAVVVGVLVFWGACAASAGSHSRLVLHLCGR